MVDAGLIVNTSCVLAGTKDPFAASCISSISVIPAGSTAIQNVEAAAVPYIKASVKASSVFISPIKSSQWDLP